MVLDLQEISVFYQQNLRSLLFNCHTIDQIKISVRTGYVVAFTLIWLVQNYSQFTVVWYSLTKLQRIQNRLALLMTMSLLVTRSVSLLHSFHWLPVKFRILLKISLLTYKMLHGKQPIYLHSMLAASLPSRSQKSNPENQSAGP